MYVGVIVNKKMRRIFLLPETEVAYSGWMIGFKISLVDLAILLIVVAVVVILVRKLRK
jgi:hypothetical protein